MNRIEAMSVRGSLVSIDSKVARRSNGSPAHKSCFLHQVCVVADARPALLFWCRAGRTSKIRGTRTPRVAFQGGEVALGVIIPKGGIISFPVWPLGHKTGPWEVSEHLKQAIPLAAVTSSFT